MPGVFKALGKVIRHGPQILCVYPSAFESEEERISNYSFPRNVEFEDVTITTSDKISLECYLLRASQRRNRTETPNSSHSRLSFRTSSPSVTPRALVIMFHGNGYHAWHHGYSGQQFLRLGCDVLLVEYRGYGRSSGVPSEKGLRRDAQAALEYVISHPELSRLHIIIHGHSLGGAVAIDLAGRNPEKISGLIIENTFLSIPEVAKAIPGIRHFTFVIHQRWESYRRILRIPKSIPILMFSGKKDEVVPELHMLQLWKLAASRGEGTDLKKDKKRRSRLEGEVSETLDRGNDMFKSIPEGTHADTWTRSGYWSTIDTFLKKLDL
ncbi:alpha/beta-hydrolase [Gymnopus androsaceus JB14]|uniref:Alpha/beta-hydrolase n=1 Tax=Gymnopus androsaceus JB14 TaxID=1447944 RepID=A0A6A4I1C1_9AGAR|nr:alpha/beta-hydrolase [Gymnopus androsaceus JB14]